MKTVHTLRDINILLVYLQGHSGLLMKDPIMKILFLAFFLLALAYQSNAQQKTNTALKHELDSIYALDQKYRRLLSLKNKDSVAKLYNVPIQDLNSFLSQKMESADSSNLIRIEEIIKQYGYPGKTLVGTPTNEAVFYVLQHSPKIKQYFSYVEQAAKTGELPFIRYALMQDRLLMQEEKEQIYGTQVYNLRTVNQETRKEEWKTFVWPIKNPNAVNKIRKQAGFDQTIEEYAKRFDIEFRIITLEEVKKIRGNTQ